MIAFPFFSLAEKQSCVEAVILVKLKCRATEGNLGNTFEALGMENIWNLHRNCSLLIQIRKIQVTRV